MVSLTGLSVSLPMVVGEVGLQSPGVGLSSQVVLEGIGHQSPCQYLYLDHLFLVASSFSSYFSPVCLREVV